MDFAGGVEVGREMVRKGDDGVRGRLDSMFDCRIAFFLRVASSRYV